MHELTAQRFRQVTWVSLLLALLLGVPSLDLGLVLDDHGHRLFLLDHLAHGGSDFLDMFDICGRQGPSEIAQRIREGMLPWWTLPELSIALFRPLSVITHYVDYILWPRSPALMHVHNIALYAGLLLAVGALYRRWLGTSVTAALALLFYAVDEAHAGTVAWIAGRNTLLCALFVVLTLLAHDRARRDASRLARALAPLSLVLACASGEGALAVWAYLLPYAWLIDRGTARSRWLSLLPLAVVTLVWSLLYRAAGYGVHGSGFYRDPLDAPWWFVTERLPEAWPELLREQLTLPALVLSEVEVLRPWPVFHALSAVAVISLLALAWHARRIGQGRVFAFFLLACSLSMVPVAAVGAHPRLLLVPGVAGFALCAQAVVWLAACARKVSTPWRRRVIWALAAAPLLVHGPLALAFAPLGPRELARMEGAVSASANMLPRADAHGRTRVFVLDTPTYYGTLLARMHREPNAPALELHVLCASGRYVLLTRVSPEAFTLEPDGGFLREGTSQLVRAPERPFVLGERIVTARFDVTVERLRPDGRPARVRFHIPGMLDPHNVLVRWHASKYQRVRLPPVGGRVWLMP